MKIRYFLVTAVLATAILGFGAGASAQTTDVQALIAQLQAQIQSLMQQIAAIQAQQGTTQTWCHTFNTNLGFANSGSSEVGYLHTALEKQSISYSPDKGNVYAFGTYLAVVRFQTKYRISPTGFVGPSTRAKLNALYGCSTTQPSITVTSPNGGEQWQQGSTQKITWTTTNIPTSNNMTVRLRNSAGVEHYIYSAVGDIVTNYGFFSITVPSTLVAGLYKVEVKTSVNGQSYLDASDNYFSIVSSTTQPVVGISAPNTGEQWQMGSTYTIRWFADKFSTTDKINIILLDARAGYSYYVIAKDVIAMTHPNIGVGGTPSGEYSWTIPTTGFVPSSSNPFKIYIGKYAPSAQSGNWESLRASAESEVYGYGNNFSIVSASAAPIINEISTGGAHGQSATVMQGQSTVIGLYGYNFTGAAGSFCGINTSAMEGITRTGNCNVASLTIGFAIQVSQNATPGDRQLTITTPNGTSNTVTLTVLSSSVNRSVKIISPNGGETWKFGETHRITWISQGIDRVAIYIYNDTIFGSGSTNYLDPAMTSLSVPASQGYFDWTILQNWLPKATSGNENRYKISISDVNSSATGIRDTSDNYFSIVSSTQPSITVTSPNGGETWKVGETKTISWTSTGLNSSKLLQISLERKLPTDSQYWNIKTIASLQPQNGSYNWTIPADVVSAGATYKIMVAEHGLSGLEIVDESDNYFSIVQPGTAPTITSVSPNSGSQSGTSVPIDIYGTGFTAGSVVRFDNLDITTSATLVSTTYLQTTLTSLKYVSAGAHSITVTNPDGQISNPVSFNVLASTTKPSITFVSPNYALENVTKVLNIYGTGFRNGAVVMIDSSRDRARNTTFISATQLQTTIITDSKYGGYLTVGTHYITIEQGTEYSNSVPFSVTTQKPSYNPLDDIAIQLASLAAAVAKLLGN